MITGIRYRQEFRPVRYYMLLGERLNVPTQPFIRPKPTAATAQSAYDFISAAKGRFLPAGFY
jgi:hypothetical protein